MNSAAAPIDRDPTLREVMNTDFAVLTPDDTLRLVDDLVVRRHLHDFPVLYRGRLFGAIFHADLLCTEMTHISGLTGVGRKEALSNIVVREVMKPATTALPDTSINNAAQLIVESSIEGLIVIEDEEILGLISRTELLRIPARS